jgi:hypothetical protein
MCAIEWERNCRAEGDPFIESGDEERRHERAIMQAHNYKQKRKVSDKNNGNGKAKYASGCGVCGWRAGRGGNAG